MFASMGELESGVCHIKKSPGDIGTVELIVRRPDVNTREVVEFGELNLEHGLVGDNWLSRGFRQRPDGSAHPDMQLNIMNSRCAALIAKTKDRWPLAGDQFYVDLDLSYANLPPGSVLHIGSAKIAITAEPHLGCKKFLERFGKDAVTFVNSEQGKLLNLRGLNAKVLTPGAVRVGDKILKGP